MSQPRKYYVLIHYAFAAFIVDDDGDAYPFDTFELAEAAARQNHACSQIGYTVIGWHAKQGGDGPIWFGDRRNTLPAGPAEE